MSIDLHTAILCVTTIAAGWLMSVAGVGKSALEWRRQRRICPSCGRQIDGGVCGCGSV